MRKGDRITAIASGDSYDILEVHNLEPLPSIQASEDQKNDRTVMHLIRCRLLVVILSDL